MTKKIEKGRPPLSVGEIPKDGIFFPQETVPKGGVFWIIKTPYCDYKIYYKNSDDCNDGYSLLCFLNSPPGEYVNSFTER